jgi:hypothetical protein
MSVQDITEEIFHSNSDVTLKWLLNIVFVDVLMYSGVDGPLGFEGTLCLLLPRLTSPPAVISVILEEKSNVYF